MSTHLDPDSSGNTQTFQSIPTDLALTSTTKYESDKLLDGTEAKYLTVLFLYSDIGDPQMHEERDNKVLEALEKDEYSHLKSPKSDADYIGLMRLLTTHSASLMFREYYREDYLEHYLKKHYLHPKENTEDTRAEFFKLVKLCLERKKFRSLRILGEFSRRI